MHRKTPSAAVLPGAITADQKKNMIPAVAKQKPNKGGKKRLDTSSTALKITQWKEVESERGDRWNIFVGSIKSSE